MQRNAESRDCATELQKYVSEEREWKGRRGGRGEREKEEGEETEERSTVESGGKKQPMQV